MISNISDHVFPSGVFDARLWYIEDNTVKSAHLSSSTRSASSGKWRHTTAITSHKVPGEPDIKFTSVHVPSSNKFVVAVSDKGELFGMGENKYGRMPGKAGTTNTFEKLQVPNDEKVAKVFVGVGNTHILTEEGHIYGIGSNAKMQLGFPKNTERTKWVSPEGIEDGVKFTDLQTSGGVFIAKTDKGHFYSWGANIHAPVLNNKSAAKYVTPLVVNLPPVLHNCKSLVPTAGLTSTQQEIAASKSSIYGVGNDGKLYDAYGKKQKFNSTMSDVMNITETRGNVLALTSHGLFALNKMDEYPEFNSLDFGAVARKYYVDHDENLSIGVVGSGTRGFSKDSLYLAHNGVPYVWTAPLSARGRFTYDEDVTMELAVDTHSLLGYPVEFISNNIC